MSELPEEPQAVTPKALTLDEIIDKHKALRPNYRYKAGQCMSLRFATGQIYPKRVTIVKDGTSATEMMDMFAAHHPYVYRYGFSSQNPLQSDLALLTWVNFLEKNGFAVVGEYDLQEHANNLTKDDIAYLKQYQQNPPAVKVWTSEEIAEEVAARKVAWDALIEKATGELGEDASAIQSGGLLTAPENEVAAQ